MKASEVIEELEYGDWLVEEDDGKWHVEEGDEE